MSADDNSKKSSGSSEDMPEHYSFEEETEEKVEHEDTKEEFEDYGEEHGEGSYLEDTISLPLDYDEYDDYSLIPIRRKSIYELDSYDVGTAPVVRYSESIGIPGVARITLSPLTQKIVGCVIDENVTTEYPWIYVDKETVEDNIYLHSESSDFLCIRNEVARYPEERLLLGYAPGAGEAEFYVCLTEESRSVIAGRIEALRREQQKRVRSAVEKEPRSWADQGTGALLDDQQLRKNRPLFEIEVESRIDRIVAPPVLVNRGSAQQRDGYIEIVPHRESFTNVERLIVDKACTIAPATAEDNAQTELSIPANFACQSSPRRYDPPESAGGPVRKHQQQQQHLSDHPSIEQLFKETETNTTWDVYANDYAKLAVTAAKEPPLAPPELRYEEQQSYYEGKSCSGRVMNDLSWHPLWTGVFAAAYTHVSKGDNLVGKPPEQERPNESHVLVWSFDDCLRPKLILASERHVTSVSFCPHNGNIIVGGCQNGQVVVWDITGRIEESEKIIVQTTAEARHSIIVKSLGTWMRDTLDPIIVRATATSSLQYSQNEMITKMEWLWEYSRINEMGNLRELPADTPVENLSLQFVTSSLDGSIAFWDLSLQGFEEKKVSRARVGHRAKLQFVSPYKQLDGILKPIYMLIVQHVSLVRNVKLTGISIRREHLRKVQVEPRLSSVDVMIQRRHFNILYEKNEQGLPTGIFVTTASGECGVITWEGYDFTTGLNLNKEICKWTWHKQLHDGPISHVARSPHLKDTLLTVGGRIFAVWREDIAEPVLFRKSEFRYTACSWDSGKPTVIILGRNDGIVEIWDVFHKSHEPNITQSLSGRIVTGIYAHELPLNPACVGICDYNGALRTFLAPKLLFASNGESDIKWMRQFVDREVNKIKDFYEFERAFHEKAESDMGDKKSTAGKRSGMNEAVGEEKAKPSAIRKTADLIEVLHRRWVKRELNRMQTAILDKKGLRGEELKRRREPVMKLRREAREREAHRNAVIAGAEDLFQDAVVTNLPQDGLKMLSGAAASPRTSKKGPATGGAMIPLRLSELPNVVETSDEEIIEAYRRIEAEALSKMVRESHELDFCWQDVIKQGLERRKSMDVNLKMHKIKLATLKGQYGSTSSGSLESFEDHQKFSSRG